MLAEKDVLDGLCVCVHRVPLNSNIKSLKKLCKYIFTKNQNIKIQNWKNIFLCGNFFFFLVDSSFLSTQNKWSNDYIFFH